MRVGKHTDEGQAIKKLKETIALKEREITDIKKECAEQFKKIKELCFCNDYNGKLDKLRKIEEIATENSTVLIKDLLISEKQEKANVISIEQMKNIHKKEVISC